MCIWGITLIFNLEIVGGVLILLLYPFSLIENFRLDIDVIY
jgi:hypothetical protein